jgi:hypothetical protein
MNVKVVILAIIVPLVSGLFGGIAWSAWWELYAHPVRERRNLSLALASELATNQLHVLLLGAPSGANERPPDGFGLQTAVFNAVAGRLGELDPALLGRVAIVYQLIGNLNRLAEDYGTLDSQPEVPNRALPGLFGVRFRQGAIARAFWEQMQTLETQLDEVVPALAAGRAIGYRIFRFREGSG